MTNYIGNYGCNKEWYQNGLLHRTAGPAFEHANGSQSWYQNGKLHRTDGPAVENANGYKSWYQNGLLHRTDGPAIEYAAGDKYWYINGSKLPFNEFIIIAKWSNERIVLWKLKHGQG